MRCAQKAMTSARPIGSQRMSPEPQRAQPSRCSLQQVCRALCMQTKILIHEPVFFRLGMLPHADSSSE